jgi:histidinol phosphatase-like enzyme (inositol monophosphatase family)
MKQDELLGRLELARRIAVEAGRATLPFFRHPELAVQRKADGSPLTQADQLSETLMRESIATSFPSDSIIGEEFGTSEGTSGWQWILDPIDGTKSFIAGVPLYGTMVGVGRGGQSEIGVIYFPALDQGMFAQRGGGCWYFEGTEAPKRSHVSQKSFLSDSVMVTSAVETFRSRGSEIVYDQIASRVYFSRTWGDAYGYMLVALGYVEIMIDPILSIWDAAAVQPIIEEAGGRFSDWAGNRRIDSGDAIGTNGLVHEEVLKIISAAAT